MLAVILALTSSRAYGGADFLGGLATRRAHVLRTVAVAAPASLAVELALWPVFGAVWSPSALGWGAASGIASAAAFALLYRTLAIGPMSVLSPVTALVSAVLPVVVGLAEGERLALTAAVGVPVALVAVVLVSAAPGSTSAASRPARAALVLAVGAGAAIAAQLVCLHQSPPDSGLAPLLVGRAVSAGAVLCVLWARRRRLDPRRPPLATSAAAGALDSLANLAFLLAARHGDLAIVAVLTALYPAGTVLLARTLLAERLGPRQLAGLGIGAVAVSLLALP